MTLRKKSPPGPPWWCHCGSGLVPRFKVAEAFSRRCALVSTPLGVYGCNIDENERELLIADYGS